MHLSLSVSLRGGTLVSGEEGVEFGFPWLHILWRSPNEHTIALFLHWILVLEALLDVVVLLVVFLILLEHFWVL